MSATLDTMLFRSFFGNATIIHVPGRTFPVNTYYLEDLLQITGHRIEEDSVCARRNISDRTSVSLWVTTRNGEKRKETADIYNQQGRADLAEVETAQALIMEEYLPKQMTEDEIRAVLKAL